jgi:hypothetical protein
MGNIYFRTERIGNRAGWDNKKIQSPKSLGEIEIGL